MGKPKQTRLPDLGGLSPYSLVFLLAGKGKGARWGSGRFENAEEAWKAYGPELTRFWTDPRLAGKSIVLPMKGSPTLRIPGPGHMPWAFWAYEAPEPRRLVLGDGTAAEIWAMSWAQGLRKDWNERPRARFDFGIPIHVPPGTRFESEADFLRRLGMADADAA